MKVCRWYSYTVPLRSRFENLAPMCARPALMEPALITLLSRSPLESLIADVPIKVPRWPSRTVCSSIVIFDVLEWLCPFSKRRIGPGCCCSGSTKGRSGASAIARIRIFSASRSPRRSSISDTDKFWWFAEGGASDDAWRSATLLYDRGGEPIILVKRFVTEALDDARGLCFARGFKGEEAREVPCVVVLVAKVGSAGKLGCLFKDWMVTVSLRSLYDLFLHWTVRDELELLRRDTCEELEGDKDKAGVPM